MRPAVKIATEILFMANPFIDVQWNDCSLAKLMRLENFMQCALADFRFIDEDQRVAAISITIFLLLAVTKMPSATKGK
jgi:hypothetical protein